MRCPLNGGKAKAEQSAVIFVSEDQKEDWWREFDGRKIGPRVELVDEFMQRTGKRAYFLTPPGLVELANEYGATITEDTVREITEVSEEQARIQERFVIDASQNMRRNFPTHELEDQIRGLRRLRREMRSHLRSLDEQRSLLGSDESRDLELTTRLSAEMSNRHHEFDALNDHIEQLENELVRRKRSLTREDRWLRRGAGRIEIARYLLNRAGVEVIDDEVDWFEVPNTTMQAVLKSFDSGHAPQKFELALRDLQMLYNDQRFAADAPEATISNRRRYLGDENLYPSRVARNRDEKTIEESRKLAAKRRRFFNENSAHDNTAE